MDVITYADGDLGKDTECQPLAEKSGIKFTSLMCWCIGRAASNIEEFYLLPENGKLFRFDKLVINVIVANRQGGINFCDIPFSDDLEQFNRDYLEFTQRAATECKSSFIEDCMIIGTSAIIQTELDCIVNQYTEKYSNPLVMWGKYRKGLFKTVMPVSFQFDSWNSCRRKLQAAIKNSSLFVNFAESVLYILVRGV